MASGPRIRLRRVTDAVRATLTPDDGEPIWTTDLDQLWIGDGTTVGGIGPVATLIGGDLTIPDDLVVTDQLTVGGIAEFNDILQQLRASPLLILFSTTASDADGGRPNVIVLGGLTAGLTQHYLAEIKAKHEGSGADQKGRLEFKVNAGSDGFAPALAAYIQADKDLVALRSIWVQSRGKLDGSGLTANRTITLADADVHLGDHLIVPQAGARLVGASQTSKALPITDADEYVLPYAGELRALSARSDTAQPSGATGDVAVWKNGAAIVGATVQINSGAQNPSAVFGSPTTLAAGDRIGIRITTNSTWTTADVAGYPHIMLRADS